MVYVGWKSTNVNFTVQQIEQLNWTKRGRAGIYKIPERNWSVGTGALPPNTSQVHVLYSSCLVWFIADFLFWWGHDDFSHEFKDPPQKKKGPFWTLSPKHCGHCTACRKPARKYTQSWPGWLERFCLWGSWYITFHYQISALRREKLFASSPSSAFLVVILSGYACLV